MAHVQGGTFGSFLVGLEGVKELALGDYLMDLHEVTNRQFKAFVDAGAYTKREYWTPAVTRGGKQLSWEEAIKSLYGQNRPTGSIDVGGWCVS